MQCFAYSNEWLEAFLSSDVCSEQAEMTDTVPIYVEYA